MSNAVYPSFPGLRWNQTKTPIFSTKIQRTVSLKEIRAQFAVYPLYEYTLAYEALRDSLGRNEFRTLLGFYLDRGGAFESFLYQDPSDYQIANQAIGIGNNSGQNFQMIRTFGGNNGNFAEPILDIQQETVTGNTLVTNGGFSNNTSGWTASGANLTSAANGVSGNCLQLLRTANNSQLASQAISTPLGNSYRYSFYVKAGNAPANTPFFGSIVSSNGVVLAVVNGTVPANWTQMTLNFKPITESSNLYLAKNSSNNGAILFDTAEAYLYSVPLNIFVANNIMVPTVDYSVSYNTGVLSFVAAPANGAAITADFWFYRRVRFQEYAEGDEAFNQFMKDLWNSSKVSFVTVKE